ncbi:hypothetical protein TYRP_004093, partial [Tyrophagus putrescentiae]
ALAPKSAVLFGTRHRIGTCCVCR